MNLFYYNKGIKLGKVGDKMEIILNKVMTFIAKDNELDDDEAEVVRYGLEIVITRAIFVVIIAITGLLMNCLFESAVFAVSFTLLREYGGGYHAETRGKCFVLSILTLIAALSIIKLAENFQFLTFPICGIALVSVIYILLKAPIDTPNKRFDEEDIKIYGRKARLLTVILLVAAVLLWILNLGDFAFTVLTGIIIQAYLMIKGQISNSRNREEV